MSREHIAKTLKKLRLKTNLTADQVGAIIGKSGKTVNAWENNRGQPDADELLTLCDIYNVDDIMSEFRESTMKRTSSSLDEEHQSALDLYSQLDTIDRAEIRGMMKQMLRADKYSDKSNSKLA